MRWQIAGLSAIAGAVAALCLPPLNLLPAVFCLAYPALQLGRAKTWPAAALISAATGLGWFTSSTHWIAHSLLVGEAEFWFLLPFAALGIPALLAMFWCVAGVFAWKLGGQASRRITLFILFLGLAEFARGHIATGFPWNAPGYLVSVHPALLQSASWFGLYGLNLLVLCFAISPAYFFVRQRPLGILFFCIMPLIAGLGAIRLADNIDGHNGIVTNAAAAQKIRLVQPSIPQADKWDRDKRQKHFDQILRLSTSKMPIPRLVVWPETAFSAFPGRNAALLRDMATAALPFDGNLITGLPRLENGRLFNSAALVDAMGEITAIYDKRRLVPFGEFAPFRRFLPFVDVIAGPVDFSAGENDSLFDVPGYGKVRLLICYETIFSGEIVNGEARPDLIVNITNDAWFGRTLGPWQHLAQSRMRAVEEGIAVIRVANNGISAGFDGFGRSLGQIDLDDTGIIDVAAPPALSPTLFSKYRHSAFFLFSVLLALLALRLDRKAAIRQ